MIASVQLLLAVWLFVFGTNHNESIRRQGCATAVSTVAAFRCEPQLARRRRNHHQSLSLAATSKQKKKSAAAMPSSIKGFGGKSAAASSVGSSSPQQQQQQTQQRRIEWDRSPATLAFCTDYLEKGGARDTVQRTALAYTYTTTTTTNANHHHHNDTASSSSSSSLPLPLLRGVVATRDIPKGNDIIAIPYELALNLGPEGSDPTVPALSFLRDYCTVLQPQPQQQPSSTIASNRVNWTPHATASQLRLYYQMLPGFQSDDCRGSCDFFSRAALEALQSPLLVEETLARRAQAQRRFQWDIHGNADTFPLWIDGVTPVTVEHLQWAVWIVTSRVLAVQSTTVGSSTAGSLVRLLIPYLDMCNHDRSSPHILTGRADPGGLLKVVAGTAIRAGDDVTICYGGGMSGNDAFLAEYGFLDTTSSSTGTNNPVDGYSLVAHALLGTTTSAAGRRSVAAGRSWSRPDRERSLAALRATTMAQDEEALVQLAEQQDNSETASLRTAIQYRLGVKRAMAKLGVTW
jgi:SET domain